MPQLRAVTTMESIGHDYFKRIQAIWEPFASLYPVIPFCTPVFRRPTALVIGKNHGDFAPGDPENAARIALRYKSAIPTDNTFMAHDHRFAKGLQSACTRAGIKVDGTWMGTNRCAVQTDSTGIDELTRWPEFADCQSAMDDLLKELVCVIRPFNLLLVGRHAVGLFYPAGTPISDLACDTLFGREKPSTRVIPTFHPSRGRYHRQIAAKLKTCWVDPNATGQ